MSMRHRSYRRPSAPFTMATKDMHKAETEMLASLRSAVAEGIEAVRDRGKETFIEGGRRHIHPLPLSIYICE